MNPDRMPPISTDKSAGSTTERSDLLQNSMIIILIQFCISNTHLMLFSLTYVLALEFEDEILGERCLIHVRLIFRRCYLFMDS